MAHGPQTSLATSVLATEKIAAEAWVLENVLLVASQVFERKF